MVTLPSASITFGETYTKPQLASELRAAIATRRFNIVSPLKHFDNNRACEWLWQHGSKLLFFAQGMVASGQQMSRIIMILAQHS